MDMMETTVQTMTATIRRAENGFVVTVFYPADMIRRNDPVAEGFLQGIQKAARLAQEGEGMKPVEIADVVRGIIGGTQSVPLRKPHEEYVFASLEKAMAFLHELFSGDRVKEKA